MLIAHSYYSLLRGASSPAALVARAKELGLRSLALADDEGLYGAVEFWKRCKEAGIRPVLGATIDGHVYLVKNRTGYANLCRLITARKLGRAHGDTTGLLVPANVRHAWFARPEDWKVHKLLSAIRENTLWAHVEDVVLPDAALTPCDDPLLDECDWEFLPAPKVFPKFEGDLRALCFRGLAWRYPENPPFERLRREMDVIEKLGFSDYFLVVHDIVRHSRERGVPVAGRGSGASSVVAYVLGITNVDPIAFDLPFERFLHEGRADFPDLDVDFCWKIRDDILAYVFERFPDSAMVSTHITFQHRSAFREAAKVFGFSEEQVTALQRGRVTVPELPRIRAAARAILGFPRHLSVHCGGVVLRPDGVAPMQRAEKGVVVTQYDKDSVEEAGLVKIDLLGNRALSTIRETVEIVERTTGERIDVERLPSGSTRPFGPRSPHFVPAGSRGVLALSEAGGAGRVEVDEESVRLLQEGRTLGCNQLESPAMRALLRMTRPCDVRGVQQALALIRPGAASGGMKELFVRRARGLEPSPGGLLADTHGVMLYEDDAMVLASALAGMTLAEGDRFRRRVQKARTDEERLAVSREFLARCAEPEIAKEFWIQMVKFNEFSFCRAHAASYAVLAWASAWLAAHHPVAHWIAALNNNQGLYDARVYLEQAKREGIRVLLPCVQRSRIEFGEEEGSIRVGLGRIRELERREIDRILDARPFESIGDFLARTHLSKPSLRNLIHCGALDWTGIPRPRLWMMARSGLRETPPVPDFTEEEKFARELEILGLSARKHILSYLRSGIRHPVSGIPLDSRRLSECVGRRVRLLGIMATARVTVTAREEPMEFLTLEDEHGIFEVVLFPQVFRRCRGLIGTLGPYEVTGRVEGRYDVIAVNAEKIVRAGDTPRAAREAS
ncbi:MAG: DNA polymerase III subunit alpha [Planctomycetes bacterium]|nr:DNA polymerase III subunit alpha [Planctomycetota bacterium]